MPEDIANRDRKLVASAQQLEMWFKHPINVYAALMAAYESNWANSNVAKKNNNFTGITYVGQPGATRGTAKPKSDGGGNYAKYKNSAEWAKDFKRILSMGKNPPINATTLPEFVHRLKANRYFQQDEGTYLKNLQGMFDKYWASGARKRQQVMQDITTEVSKDADKYRQAYNEVKGEPGSFINWSMLKGLKPETWVMIAMGAVMIFSRRR